MVDVGGATWGRRTQRDKPTEKLPPSGIKVGNLSALLHRKVLKLHHFVRERVSGSISHTYSCLVVLLTRRSKKNKCLFRVFVAPLFPAVMLRCCLQSANGGMLGRFYISKPLNNIVSHASLVNNSNFTAGCVLGFRHG